MRQALVAIAVTTSLTSCSLIGSLANGVSTPSYRVATYNIRHGNGMDNRIALERTAGVLRGLEADIIALQEVDNGVTRSGRVDQSLVLATLLGVERAFGAFMPYGGGEYGLAILSRYPILDVAEVRLPAGAEPRIALAATIALPNADTVTVVNVHFDWITNDNARITQARALARYLDTLSGSWLLMGDFNDLPDSRTLRLFSERVLDYPKPADSSFTFPSTMPEKEIDYILASRDGVWKFTEMTVIADTVASDHRPVLAEIQRTESRPPTRTLEPRPRSRQPR